MDTNKIKEYLEKIIRVKSDLLNENIEEFRLDLKRKFIEKTDESFNFLTSSINLEEVLFEKYKLKKIDLENIISIYDNEISIAHSILAFIKQSNKTLENIKEKVIKMSNSLETYQNTDADVLLSLLYENLSSDKLYFCNYERSFNCSITKDFIEILSDDFEYTTDYEKIYDTTNEYLKIIFNRKTFINIINFFPILKSDDEYSVFIDDGSNKDLNIFNNISIANNTVLSIEKECYSITIKGSNIKNLLTFKIMQGSRNGVANSKKAFLIMKAKLDKPNSCFQILSTDNKNYEIYLIPSDFKIAEDLLYDKVYDLVSNSNKSIKLLLNNKYNESLMDSKFVLFFNSSNYYYKLPKLLKK